MARSLEWMDDARCKGEDVNFWFPEMGGMARHQAEAARNYCASCDVQMECAQYAIDEKIPDGIWGGLSPDQRQKMRAKALREKAAA